MNINRLVLAGRLTRDVDITFTPSGTAVAKFGVALNRRFQRGEEWVEKAIFVDVIMFGKRGEAFGRYHKRGDQCCLPECELDFESWDDKATGQKRSKVYVQAKGFEFVGSKSKPDGNRGAVSDRDEAF